MTRIATALLSAFLVLLLIPTFAAAQAGSTAQIAGTVKDDTGGVLPGVTVTRHANRDRLRRGRPCQTKAGGYVIPNLPVGPYRLEATLRVFGRMSRRVSC